MNLNLTTRRRRIQITWEKIAPAESTTSHLTDPQITVVAGSSKVPAPTRVGVGFVTPGVRYSTDRRRGR